MRPLVLGLSSGQTWPENQARLFAGLDGDDDHFHEYHDDDPAFLPLQVFSWIYVIHIDQ